MTDPVNLDNLREMTGGEPEIEQELFEVFLSSSEDCLASLKASCIEGEEETWRTQAHAWKGMCLNLGAEKLAALCAEAQTNCSSPAEERNKTLHKIIDEYNLVKDYLEKLKPQ